MSKTIKYTQKAIRIANAISEKDRISPINQEVDHVIFGLRLQFTKASTRKKRLLFAEVHKLLDELAENQNKAK